MRYEATRTVTHEYVRTQQESKKKAVLRIQSMLQRKWPAAERISLIASRMREKKNKMNSNTFMICLFPLAFKRNSELPQRMCMRTSPFHFGMYAQQLITISNQCTR